MNKEEALKSVRPDVRKSDVIYDCPATLHYKKVSATPQGSTDEAVVGHILLTPADLYFVRDAAGLLTKPKVFASFSLSTVSGIETHHSPNIFSIRTPNDKGYKLGYVLNKYTYNFEIKNRETLKEQISKFLKAKKKSKK